MIAEIEAMVTKIEKVANKQAFLAKIGSKAAPLVDKAIKERVNQGVDPYGRPWAPRKSDGGRVLVHAASHISTETPRFDLISVTLRGHDVFHHKGARGAPKRQILPDQGNGLPENLKKIIVGVAKDVFKETLR